MEAAGSVFPELAAGRTVFVLRLDPEKSPAGSPVSLYVREEASRTPLEPWEKARWWWSESKERRPQLLMFVAKRHKSRLARLREERHTGVSGSRASGRPSGAQSKVSDLDLDVVQVDHHDPLRDHEPPLPAPGHLTRNMR